MVAPDLLLTARHCVSVFDDGEDGEFTCTETGELQNAGSTAGVLSELHDAGDVEVYTSAIPREPAARGTRIVALQTTSICRNDLALVVLDTALDVPLVPVRIDQGTLPGETLRVVGYGYNDTRTLERMTRDGLRVLAVGRSELYPEGGLAPPRSFAIGKSVCDGDSGGPALSEAGAVTGVFSFIKGRCEDDDVRNYYTQLAPFREPILQGFASANAEPLLEPRLPESGYGGAAGHAGAGGIPGHSEPHGAGANGEAGAPTLATESADRGGCSCRAAETAKARARLALLLGLPLVLALRRRQSPCASPRSPSLAPKARTG